MTSPSDEMVKTIRNFADEDFTDVVRLLNKGYQETSEFIPFDKDRVKSQISRHSLKLLVAHEKGQVLGVIATHPEGTSEESIHWLATDDNCSERSIEDMLIDYVEKHYEGEFVSTMIDEGSPKINIWLTRGYVLCPGFHRMLAKLDKPRPIPPLPSGIELRSLRSEEEEKLIEVINIGFGWKRLELGVLESWKSEDPPFDEDWIHVGDVEGRIVSAVVAKPDTDYLRYFNIYRGYLGPAATLPEYRNKHLAKSLTARAMNFLLDKGMTSVRLGTSEQNVSSIALLRSLGFKADATRKIIRKKLVKD